MGLEYYVVEAGVSIDAKWLLQAMNGPTAPPHRTSALVGKPSWEFESVSPFMAISGGSARLELRRLHPQHRKFGSCIALLGIHSRYGPHTRAVTNS